MRPLLFVVVGLVAGVLPAAAQFNAHYEGTQLVDGKQQPVSTFIAIEKGRAIIGLKGARSSRLVYTEKDGMLRIIDDTGKSCVDFARGDREKLAAQVEDMQKKMEQMPAEQRAAAEKMMGGGMGTMGSAGPPTFVWSEQTQTVQGYQCTRVDVLRGGIKKAEYWGTRSADFEMAPDERKALIGLQEALHGLTAVVAVGVPAGGETRPFEWDTKTEGYPLISRCFDGDQITLDIHLVSFDRKPIDAALAEVPTDYSRQEMPTDLGGKGRRKKH